MKVKKARMDHMIPKPVEFKALKNIILYYIK